MKVRAKDGREGGRGEGRERGRRDGRGLRLDKQKQRANLGIYEERLENARIGIQGRKKG